MTTSYRVSELFGPTIQGEGAQIGRPTMFVRLGGCDYRCTWCDSLHAVDPQFKTQWAPMSAPAILARLTHDHHMPPGILITLSGGNPALYDCTALLLACHAAGHPVTLETQASIPKPWFRDLDHLCLSPKPPSSGHVTTTDHVAACLAVAPHDTILKIVVFDADDLAYAESMHRTFPAIPCYLQVGNLTPSTPGDVADALLRAYAHLVATVLARPSLSQVRVLPQLHTLLWGNRRRV